MEDRFKVRIWDGEDMFYPGTYQISPHIDISSVDVLMQCTGLKDKNGVLIWEGDVVKTPYGNGIVVEGSGCFMIEWVGVDSNRELVGIIGRKRREEIWVIGNIHENPELLEETK